MFGGIFSRHHSGVPVLIADVENGSVAAAVMVPNAKGPARVLASCRIDVPIGAQSADQARSTSIASLGDATKQIVERYAQSDIAKTLGPIQALQAIVGPSLSRSRTVKLEEHYHDEKSISDSMIQALAQKALQIPSELDGANILETHVTRVQLNGYPTSRPIGKRARDLAVTAFQSDIVAGVEAQIEHALGVYAPGRKVDIRSQTRAILTVLHELSPETRNYLLLNVGGDTSHFVTIRKEELAEHATGSTGTAKILADLSGEGGSPESTLTLLHMVSADTCSDEACEKMKASLAKTEPALLKTFGEIFATLSASRRVPNECILVVRTDMAPWLENFFTRLDFSQFSVTAQPLSVTSLEPDHLQDFVQWHADVPHDTGIGIIAAFVNMSWQAKT